MYNWDDILILGDSYAFSRDHQTDWPTALTIKLTGQQFSSDKLPRGAGYPGCSWWSTRNRLLKEISIRPPKVLVICHTEFSRLPSDEDFGLTFSGLSTKKIWSPSGMVSDSHPIMSAGTMYYKYMYSEQFYLWAMKQWLNDLDSIIIDAGIERVIHLPCFALPEEICPKQGITSEEILFEIHERLLGENAGYVNDAHYHRNHMDVNSNITFANSMYEAIINYDPSQNGKRINLNIHGK